MKHIAVSAVFFVILMLSAALVGAQDNLPTCQVGSDCETGKWGVSAEEIAAYPEPNVEQIYAANSDLYDRTYRRVNGAVNIHDAPNGNVVSTLGSGFNFVTLMTEQDGWAQIAENQWVKSESLTTDVPVSNFAGVYLPEGGLKYPMAWVLVNLYPSKFPGGEPSKANELLLQYTKVSLYSTMVVDGWQWYQIGVDQWVKQTQVGKIVPVERFAEIDTERWVSVDLFEQTLVAYEGATPVFATLIASGLPEWSTNEGLFRVYVRYPRTPMSGGEGREDFYYLEEVPWTMYFDKDIAIHGTYWHNSFGYRRSHGCVNASITDAKMLYNWASEEFDFTVSNDLGPAVYVYSSGDYK